ncbi:MAG: L,D-transpeptidase family protein [Paracoccaceae bacterium]
MTSTWAQAQESATALTSEVETMGLGPASQALFDALASVERPAMADWYAANDYAPIWNDDAAVNTLLAAIADAPANGLPAARYDVEGLRMLEAAAGRSVEAAAAFEVAASALFLKYAVDVSTGIIAPSSLSDMIDRNRPVADIYGLLDSVAINSADPAFYDALEPQDPVYAALKAELVRLRVLIAEGESQPRVGPGRSLRPGQSDERVLALRVRLVMQGYNDVAGDSPVYDDFLVDAVKAFQTVNNLDADGIIGPKTLEAINADPTQHYQQVLVNLERARWMNFERGERHIWVNTASFMGYVIDNGVVTLDTRVVVGKSGARFQTVEFSDEMEHMVVNPSWNVPESIASMEYLPDILRDPTLLARQNIEMQVRGSGRLVDPRLVDLSQYTVTNFPYVLRQRPGSGNALGRVKFMFPNRHNIYLHDTPSRSLFNRDTRAFSHGCVRVHKPLELAYTLLAPQTADPEGDFTAVLNTRRETQVNLDVHVPVHLVYNTVFLNDLGALEYRIDIYDRDALVFNALSEAGVALPSVQG